MNGMGYARIENGQAFRLFHRIGWPDLGSIDAWAWWMTRTWQGLEDIGWFNDLAERGSYDHQQQQRLTVFALRWLAEDLCEQMADGNVPYWDDWVGGVEIDAELAITAAARHPGWAEVDKLVREECYEEAHLDIMTELETEVERAAEIEHFEGELSSMLNPQAVCFVAAQMRPVLLRSLDRVWGDRHRLFQSWWALLHSNELMRRVDNEDMCYDEHDNDDESEGNAAILTRTLADQLNHYAIDAFDDVFALDEDTGQRLAVFGWVTSGCPIAVRGEPAFLA